MFFGVADAAQSLGISPARVRRLIASGALPAIRVGRMYLLEARDVDAMASRARPPHVRAFSARISWAAAAVADGLRPDWVRNDELSRLRSRLTTLAGKGPDVDAWAARLARLAGGEHRLRIGPDQVEQLLADSRVVRGGPTATSVPGDRLINTSEVDVWVADADLPALRRQYGLLASTSGNVVVRLPAVPHLTRLGTDGENVYRLVVVAGLVRSGDARTRAAGRALLQQTLLEACWRQSRAVVRRRRTASTMDPKATTR